ncbi:hypothetical protein CLOSTHATH_06155 [Hungatella hathewayi DSM 13479]|uniref:Uncharacterized protein n=1 Tax=Hungatella hathewayi DSM 13479 TaxID=566550 RepID=D3AR98_9FIRM|nr:hypothetical protein CLOSTHATH_06155 [Hungatella hathewayi DSM 13479]
MKNGVRFIKYSSSFLFLVEFSRHLAEKGYKKGTPPRQRPFFVISCHS